MRIDGSTKIVGVYGAPIAHTASPAMHNAAFDALGMNWVYLAFHVDPRHLKTALQGARDMGMVGVNLTVPHKVLALEMMDEMDPDARRLGAVNTIAFRDNRILGYNTDGYGIAHALREDFNIQLRDRHVLVLGAGGAGRAIAVQAALEGAARVVVANRTMEKVIPIANEIASIGIPFQATPIDPEKLREILRDVEVVINATSIGLQPGDTLGLESQMFTVQHYVYDTIYRPARTALLHAASQAGARVANGLTMLLHQGGKAFEIWTGQTAPLAVMRRALCATIGGEPS